MEQAEIHRLFEYRDGRLFWKVRPSNRSSVGDVAGCQNKSGYNQIRYRGKTYKNYRLVWSYFNGEIPEELEIDHINGVRNDDRIENLRPVTRQQNAFNRKKAKGYHLENGMYRAYIYLDGKKKNLGSFVSETEARNAYMSAKRDIHGM